MMGDQLIIKLLLKVYLSMTTLILVEFTDKTVIFKVLLWSFLCNLGCRNFFSLVHQRCLVGSLIRKLNPDADKVTGAMLCVSEAFCTFSQLVGMGVIGWAFADALLHRLAPLWVGARGLEFTWEYLLQGIESNANLVFVLISVPQRFFNSHMFRFTFLIIC